MAVKLDTPRPRGPRWCPRRNLEPRKISSTSLATRPCGAPQQDGTDESDDVFEPFSDHGHMWAPRYLNVNKYWLNQVIRLRCFEYVESNIVWYRWYLTYLNIFNILPISSKYPIYIGWCPMNSVSRNVQIAVLQGPHGHHGGAPSDRLDLGGLTSKIWCLNMFE